MRIVHFLQGRVNPNGTNGGDRVIYHLAKTTAEIGEEVFILALSDKPPLPIGRATVRHFARPRNAFTLPSSLTSELLALKPDIVHFHGVYTPRNVVLARWLRRQAIPYAVSPHGGLMPGVLTRSRMKKELFLRIVARPYLGGASLIHAVSDAELDAVRRFCPKVPVAVGHHGIEGVNLESLDSRYLCRRYPALEGKRVLGFLGRLDPFIKGLDLLAEACSRVRPSMTDTVIVLAGPDWRGRAYPFLQSVAELGLSNLMQFVGPIVGREKFDFLASCDGVILSSRSEGLPLSILEALEVGKPCLVTEAANLGDFFRCYGAGLQVPATVDGITEGLRFFVTASSEELRHMGEEGRRGVLRQFSWERTAKILLRAYRQVCGELLDRTAEAEDPLRDRDFQQGHEVGMGTKVQTR